MRNPGGNISGQSKMKLWLKQKIAIVVFFSIVLVSGCATTKPEIGMPVPGKEGFVLKTLCELQGIDWQWDTISQVVVLKGNGREAKALVGSDVVLIGDERILLSAPVAIENSAVTVPADFKRMVMSRLIKKVLYPEQHFIKKIETILIDPGHGGKDPGAIGVRGTYEKDIVLSIAKHLKRNLEQRGFKVIMTRERDEFISLEKRTELASRERVDLFISIHANASQTSRASGIEVFSLRDLSAYEANNDQRKRNQYLLFRNFSMEPNDNIKSIVSDMLYDHKCNQDDLLASYTAQKLSKYARARNRGYKKSGFFVLKNTIVPAILVEVGFISNPREERLLRTKSYRDNIARSLAQVIVDYNRFSDDVLCMEIENNY